MKKITIEYLPSIGELLDEKNITWYNLGDNKISIEYNKPEDLLYLGIEYVKFLNEIESEH